MRTVLLALVFTTACAASGPRPTNVAAVRAEINETIKSSSADRTVTSMGKTSPERAVVFTTNKSGVRAEETWVKAGGGWKLETAAAVSAVQ